MATKITNGLDLLQTQLLQPVLHSLDSDPTSPAEGQIWYRTDTDEVRIVSGGTAKSLAFGSAGASGIFDTDFGAHQILAGDSSASNPQGVTVAASTLVGRGASGNITALNAAAVKTILSISLADISDNGALASQDSVAVSDISGVDTAHILGRQTANTGVAEALTASEVRTLLGVEANAAADQNASEVPYTAGGNIVATDVQAAIQELDTEKTTEAYVDGQIAALGSLASQSEAALTDIAQIAGNTILGNSAGTTGDVAALDATAVKGILSLSSSDLSDVNDLATTADITTAINNLIDGAPGALDTLNELAAAINDDANFNTTIVASIAEKTKSVSADVGDGLSTSIAVTHNLGTRDIVVSVMEVSTNAMVIADWVANTTNQITLTFNTEPNTAQYRVTIIG